MTHRDILIRYLNDYLRTADFRDYGPQGLQIEGRESIRRIVTGVSSNLQLIDAAIENDADLLLVHHGLFWEGDPVVLTGWRRRRIARVLQVDLNLAAYHLCLDAHEQVGNNAVAARALGLTAIRGWCTHRGQPIGMRGEWEEPLPWREAVDRINRLYQSDALLFPFGPDMVRRVGIVSGGAQREVFTAIDDELDLFITGEASEYVMSAAREGCIHFIGAGHHNTERLGVRALGEHVAQRFELEHRFIDIPNPV